VHVRTANSLKMQMVGWPEEAYEARCADLFKQFVRQLPSLPGVSVDTTYLRGDAADTLVRYATGAHAGLIACGRLGHSFVERLFVRSVSSDVVRRSPCPVLVLPEQPGDAAR
jgi:nucleotide-binding universal stress UspA family protein